ncbi:hypothetical protein [Spirillospora sp. NPDC029432]|uniref:hypothetical protein n=1 Tax=Spirillospora sp. NPDC029432 TaxID=3154599 RepID=UPI003451E27E
MRDVRRPVLPGSPPPGRDERGRLARLLIIALGLVGFVAAPAAGATAAGAGAQTGVRAAGVPQAGQNVQGTRPAAQASGRQRTHQTAPPERAIVAAGASRQPAVAQAPLPVLAVPPPGVTVLPPYDLAERPLPASHEAPAVPGGGAPRGRAPPPSTGI